MTARPAHMCSAKGCPYIKAPGSDRCQEHGGLRASDSARRIMGRQDDFVDDHTNNRSEGKRSLTKPDSTPQNSPENPADEARVSERLHDGTENLVNHDLKNIQPRDNAHTNATERSHDNLQVGRACPAVDPTLLAAEKTMLRGMNDAVTAMILANERRGAERERARWLELLSDVNLDHSCGLEGWDESCPECCLAKAIRSEGEFRTKGGVG